MAARVDFILCQAGLAAEFSNIPGIHKYREHTYRFPCTAVKGDLCASSDGLTWRNKNKEYLIHSNGEVYNRNGVKKQSVKQLSLNHQQAITSICTNECHLEVIDPEDPQSVLDDNVNLKQMAIPIIDPHSDMIRNLQQATQL